MKNTLESYSIGIFDCEHKTAPLALEGYPSIRTPNIGKGRLLLDNVNLVSENTWKEWTKRAIPEEGDLIIAREAPAGNVAVVPPNIKLCLGQRTVLIKLNKEKVDPAFICYYLLSPKMQHELLSKSAGSTVPHVNVKDIKCLNLFEIPKLTDQKRIASILSSYDDLIENNLKRIKLLEEIAQRTYEEWFVKFRVNGEQLPIDAATGLPFGWGRKKITECLSFSQYKQKIKPFNGELKYLATADVEGTMITGEGELITWENKPSRAQIKLIRESVWFARMSKTYKIILTTSNFNDEFVISSGFAGFSPKNSHCLPFLFCLINSNDFNEKKNLFATGSTQVSLNDISLSSIQIIEPEMELIELFGEIFLSQLELRQNLIDQIRQLKQSRDILLPRLMSGKIKLESI
jgi:type I restriction enzyme S subunit